jgi:hypothetical protein
MNTIRDKIPLETLLRQFIDETQEIEVSRVEKTLNTTAKSLDENQDNVENMHNVQNLQNEENILLNEDTNEPMQNSNFNSINQNINQNMNMNSINQNMNQNMNMNSINQNMNQNMNMNSINQNMNQNMNMNSINQNMNQNMNMNSINQNMNQKSDMFEPRKSSISFNPEPSVLEIENNDQLNRLNFDNLDSELESISFEELDNSNVPIKLEFEEL